MSDPKLFRERKQRWEQEQRAKRAARRKENPERQPYTLADLASAQAAATAAEDHVANTRHNNPNRGRAGLQHARLTLSVIVSDLQARGILPKPEPTAKQLLEKALDTALPNVQSREEVEHEGKRYRRRFAKAKYGWDRWWEEVE
jgi:parvulin-like peptidyl-prolyl isomerase